ncbi:putative aldo keto reductase protein [Colletotrichum karsti]|uniref:Aldo keto reductase protein n=1 Tax=Colletotrichum karsti TaxID=1095194 RepID=A0A9P6LDC0_9PEZI|nr:putative aldo keto reductase protein [Colletotrichum karsti]KAF9871349.1 putative aldo keto reductase protein [Colletotrichum karsti]
MSSNLPAGLSTSVDSTKVKYAKLGNSGLTALPLLKAAYDKGLNTWDTANCYSNGTSEEIIGKALLKYEIPREKVIILTKCFWGVSEEPEILHWSSREYFEGEPKYKNQYGLSRAAIFNQVEASLKRLGTSYIDLLQIHRFDTTTSIEETMKALHDLVQSGKVRYIGASSMLATRFAQMQHCAERNGWTKFISMQNQYSLLYREEEREMNQFCQDTGVGLIPWAPLFRGHLARPLEQKGSTKRSGLEGDTLTAADERIIERVQEVAGRRKWPMSHVALAWVLNRVASPIIGFSKVERIDEAIEAGEKRLNSEEEHYLEESYSPKHYHVPEIL